MIKLSNKNLDTIQSKGIKIPIYNRNNFSPSLVHIGLGAFHRAHYLSYVEDLMREGIYLSGVHEIDLIPTSKQFAKSLAQQDFLFSILEKDPFGSEKLEEIGRAHV